MPAASVVVCKGRLYGGRTCWRPMRSPSAPGFTVALFGAGGTLATLGYGAALPLNLLPHAPGLRCCAGARSKSAPTARPRPGRRRPRRRTPVLVRDAASSIEVVVG